MTGLDLVKGALEMIGAWSSADGDVPDADAARALFYANLMRKSWNTKTLALHAIERQVFTWPQAEATRTIGPAGAQLTGTRPVQVLAATVTPVGQTTELTVDVISTLLYASIPDKTQTNDHFHMLAYEPDGSTTGTLTVWPVPTTAPTLTLVNKTTLAEIALGTTIGFPEGYEAAFVSQLAKRVATAFGRPWTREHEDIAREDLAAMQRGNIRVPDVRQIHGLPGSGRGIRLLDLEAGTR